MNNKTILIVIAIIASIGIIFEVQERLGTVNSDVNNSSGISLSTNPDPLQPGPATFMIEVKDKEGKLVDNAEVSFDINMTTMNMGPQQGDAISQGSGRYSAMGRMTMRGPWRVSTKVTMPDGSVENKDFTVNVP